MKISSAIVLHSLCFSPSFANEAKLAYPQVATGQVKHYNEDGEEITAPTEKEKLYGQDAQYQKGAAMSFRDNGDGTVTDLNTGLMWQAVPPTDGYSWQEAVDYCNKLELGGHSDWRLPSAKELFSISDFSEGWPYLNSSFFKLVNNERVGKDEQYWTSNKYLGSIARGGHNGAFGVNHATGHIKTYSAGRSGGQGQGAPRGERPQSSGPQGDHVGAPQGAGRPEGGPQAGGRPPGGPQGGGARRGGGGPPSFDMVLERYDKDADKLINEAEFSALLAARPSDSRGGTPPVFKTLDKDGDGKLSQDEFQAQSRRGGARGQGGRPPRGSAQREGGPPQGGARTGGARRNPAAKQVRAVRGTPYGVNKFVDNGDGTISDKATGLMWAKVDSQKGMDWASALAYAEESTLAGHSDWRLPNVKELQSIVDYNRAPNSSDPSKEGAAIDPIFQCSDFINAKGVKDYPYFWSSTSARFRKGSGFFYAWYVAFGRAVNGQGEDSHGAGGIRFDTKHKNGPAGEDAGRVFNHVRIVRDSK